MAFSVKKGMTSQSPLYNSTSYTSAVVIVFVIFSALSSIAPI